MRTIVLILGILAVSVGIQTYRIQGLRAERDQLQLADTERRRRDAMRDVQAIKNRERTNEEHAAARKRAARVVVRGNAAPGIKFVPAPAAGVREQPNTVCFDRDVLERELAALADRMAGRATELARAGEDLAAAFRACRAFTLNAN